MFVHLILHLMLLAIPPSPFNLQAARGDLHDAARTLNAFYSIWLHYGYVPEDLDFIEWKVRGQGYYLLRPELVESTYHVHR